MLSALRFITSAMVLTACFGAVVVHASQENEPVAGPVEKDAPMPMSGPLEPISPADSGVPHYSVRLHVDANLVGRVRMAREPGKPIPLNAEIAFFREGTLVDSARTNESGFFQLTNLNPGSYAATILAPWGPIDIAVEVRSFDEHATPEEMLLDIILPEGPMVIVEMLEMAIEECPVIPMGGGGQRRLGLLGLAGLAGLAGLGGDGDGDDVATPFKLHHY